MPDKSMRYRFLGQDASLGKTMSGLGDRSDKLHHSLGKLAGAFAGGLAGAGAVSFLKSSITNASDLNESLSKTRVVFGQNSKAVEVFAKAAARGIGQSEQQALEATSTFGNLFRALGIGTKPAADLSMKIVKLGGDLASFNNADPTDVLDALKSGLLGEAEPLRKFGVSLSAARVEAEALADGLVRPVKDSGKIHTALVNVEVATGRLYKAQKLHGATSLEAKKANDQLTVAQTALAKATKGAVPELTAAQKAQASYNIVMKDTKTSQGDFARTSGGLANQQRVLKAEFGNLSASLGTKLYPAATKVVSKLADALQPGSKFNDVLSDLADSAKGFAEDAKPIFSWIGDHPKLFTQIAKDAVIFGGVLKATSFLKGLGLLKGLTGGSALGGAGGLLGKVGSPVPVFVTNAGGLPTGGVPGGGKAGKAGKLEKYGKYAAVGATGIGGGEAAVIGAGVVGTYEANKYAHAHPKGFYRHDGPVENFLFGKRKDKDPWSSMSVDQLRKEIEALSQGTAADTQQTLAHVVHVLDDKLGRGHLWTATREDNRRERHEDTAASRMGRIPAQERTLRTEAHVDRRQYHTTNIKVYGVTDLSKIIAEGRRQARVNALGSVSGTAVHGQQERLG